MKMRIGRAAVLVTDRDMKLSMDSISNADGRKSLNLRSEAHFAFSKRAEK